MLVKNKAAVTYANGLARIKSILTDLKPTHVMADFELGIDLALRKVFPQATISGCWFHFCKVSTNLNGHL